MKKIALLLINIFSFIIVRSQDVVVNGYFNAADPRDEWIELLVITDNTDMRNWTLRDNNSSQTSWQTAITFKNIAFWNNMRAGTVIMVWNRIISTSSVSHALIDDDKNDGYIELSAQDATYFSGGSFGSSPSWAGNTLNIAGSGEIIEVRNASGTHVHGLGHLSSAGSDWTAMATPKLNHANSASSGDAIYVCPGAAITDYNGPASGNNFTSKNNTTITFGLPNTCGASASGNTNFWNSLREPGFTSQTLTPSIVGGNPGSISFTWASATDPNPADNTIGYIVLKNTVNSFTAPSDGVTYSVGSVIGTATVVAQTSSSASVSFTDNTINSENCYYYRVYAFRYGMDDLNGNNYNASRGRAYNQTNFATVPCVTIVLPVELLFFNGNRDENVNELEWATASEVNADRFLMQRSIDAVKFETIGIINASGTSNTISNYSFKDSYSGDAYYRLVQMDNDGNALFSNIVHIKSRQVNISVYPVPCYDGIVRITGMAGKYNYEVLDSAGKLWKSDSVISDEIIQEIPEGIFILKLVSEGNIVYKKIVSLK